MRVPHRWFRIEQYGKCATKPGFWQEPSDGAQQCRIAAIAIGIESRVFGFACDFLSGEHRHGYDASTRLHGLFSIPIPIAAVIIGLAARARFPIAPQRAPCYG